MLRSYSIASSPEQRGELRLVLRILEDGIGSRFFPRCPRRRSDVYRPDGFS